MTDDELNSPSCGVIGKCCSRWRLWIRPVVMCLYFIIIVIFLPLLILTLWKSNEYSIRFEVWLIGGLFTLLAVPISLWDITQHLVHYNKPHMQKYIIRILWMVPIYALNAWVGLSFPAYAIYLDTCRECYEAYVIYNFMMFLLTYLKQEVHEEAELRDTKTHIHHIFPLCCLKPWPIGSELIHRCKHGILQYTIVRPCSALISVICEIIGVYGEGKFHANLAYPYMIAINNLSQFIAMYHLVLFYRAHREGLQPMNPIGKFLCIKAVVFFSFFQGVIIAVLVFTGVITSWFSTNDVEHAPQGIQNFLICIEMFLAAVAHHFSFSYKPYVDLAQDQHGCCFAFLHMWDVSDVRRDVAEHIHVIRATVRRRVAGRPHRHAAKDEEKRALLVPAASQNNLMHSPVAPNGGYRTMSDSMYSDSEHEGINAGIRALKRSTVPTSTERITVQVDVERSVDIVADFVHLDNDHPGDGQSLA
ncbi:transmembrane protein 184C [Daphnia magna]|uniref:Transmembrane protein 184B n=1 Tax=Daphnia magna TaxID=35525 RepID=A0A0P5Z8A9_9CRUS|nr:transmembrane protein 184C [Daphnia magna]KZS09946.1 Transmembrane protein 184B [Daphnia magna]